MASLAPLTETLGLRRAKHLLRRTSFTFDKATLDSFANLTPTTAFNQLNTVQTNAWTEPYDPLPTGNPDGYWTSSSENPLSFTGQGRKRSIVSAWWWYNAIKQNAIKQKLTFFLHTCFTVSKDNGTGGATHFFDHIRLLDFYALGNIKTLAKKITFDNSMLYYLDNTTNNANNPNENYAREFLELFTILKGPQVGNGDYTNYTELDVQQAAKVFSGIKTKSDRSLIDSDTSLPIGRIQVGQHDQNDKTFSHRFNNQVITGGTNEDEIVQELDDFVEMIFAQDATAISYVRKLYRHFVKSEWDDEVESDIILPLAADLKNGNYELLPVVEKLFLSQHFYDADDADSSDEIIGSIIKNPVSLFNETVSFLDLDIPDPDTNIDDFFQFFRFVHNYYLPSSAMVFWSPGSVAGYPGFYQEPDFDRHWFSSNTVLARYKMIESLIIGRSQIGNNVNIRTSLDLPIFVKDNITNANNATALITEVADYLYPEPISDDRKAYFAENLLEGFPDYYWTNEWVDYLSSNDDTIVRNRLNALFTAMINAAEFQLT